MLLERCLVLERATLFGMWEKLLLAQFQPSSSKGSFEIIALQEAANRVQENADLHASISEKSEALAAAELALQTVNESLETLQRSLREQSSTSDALRQQLCQTQEVSYPQG